MFLHYERVGNTTVGTFAVRVCESNFSQIVFSESFEYPWSERLLQFGGVENIKETASQ